jgi:putative chitinase
LEEILQANPQVSNPNEIRVGQILTLPDARAATAAAPATSTSTNPVSPAAVAVAVGEDASTLSVEQLGAIVPNLARAKAADLVAPLNAAMREGKITTAARQAAFLAQIAHETGGFQWFRELGPDSYFMRYDGRRDLGNTRPGDGLRYKGRGFIQITGRNNYQKAGEVLGLDLLNNPQQAETPEVGARIAVWYWESHGLNALADQATDEAFVTITRRINGGVNGLADRQTYYARAKQVFGMA